ncbi:MAG: four helix bundle protein [Flexilinea sp.]|nr:four helix bundle protein [Flexilinea sp.]
MENAVEEKSFAFALEIVKIYRILSSEKKEFVLSRQVLRSGTSIGANVSEAQQAQSKADFISKMNIALKEAYETRYWLRLLCGSGFMDQNETAPLLARVDELIRLLVSIVIKSKQNQEK